MKDESESLRELYRQIDAQMEAKRNKPPPGDRRRETGIPPFGMSERRNGEERRSVDRLALREKEKE